MAIAFGNYDRQRGNGTNTVTMSKPTGTASGDILIFVIALNDNNDYTDITPASGFSVIISQLDSATRGHISAWKKVAGGSEPSTYSFSWVTNTDFVGILSNFSGCNTTSPIDQTNSFEVTRDTFSESGSITPSAANTMVIHASMVDEVDRISDSFSNWRDGGTTYTWTEITQTGDARALPLCGMSYALESTATAVEGFVDVENKRSELDSIIFNLSPSGGGGSLTPPGNCYFVSGWATTPGTSYITLPFGTTGFVAKCWGAGGCGSRADRLTGLKLGGGGGGGVASSKTGIFMGGTIVELIIGAGGTSAGTNDGGDTTVKTWQWTSASGVIWCRSKGGKGVAADTQTGGVGGYGDVFNFFSHTGGTGATTGGGSTGGGGGGGGAGDAANGGNGGVGTISTGGSGGSANGQTGGNGRTGSAGVGNSASGAGYGGGGGGAWGDSASTFNGGNGGNGAIYYEYYTMCDSTQGLFETN